jgi:hypothetical protein
MKLLNIPKKMKKETSNHIKFKSELILKSENSIYEDCLKEWCLIYTFKKENTCLCGHCIIKNCVFKNKHNKKLITVGSTCVKKFFGYDYSDLFTIKSIIDKFYTYRLLLLAKEKNVINDWEYNFLDRLPTFKKYSDKQVEIFFRIHEKVSKLLE